MKVGPERTRKQELLILPQMEEVVLQYQWYQMMGPFTFEVPLATRFRRLRAK